MTRLTDDDLDRGISQLISIQGPCIQVQVGPGPPAGLRLPVRNHFKSTNILSTGTKPTIFVGQKIVEIVTILIQVTSHRPPTTRSLLSRLDPPWSLLELGSVVFRVSLRMAVSDGPVLGTRLRGKQFFHPPPASGPAAAGGPRSRRTSSFEGTAHLLPFFTWRFENPLHPFR